MDMNVEPHASSALASAAPISRQIWDAKYRLKDADGTPVDLTIEDSWRRVARALAAVEAEPSQWNSPFTRRCRTSGSCRRAASCPAPAPTGA